MKCALRRIAKLGHHSTLHMLVLLPIWYTGFVADLFQPSPLIDVWNIIAAGAALLLFAGVVTHRVMPCQVDYEQVERSLDPETAAAAVAKNRWKLRFFHDRAGRFRITAGCLLLAPVRSLTYDQGLPVRWLAVAVAAFCCVSYLTVVAAGERAHDQLRLWCPFCWRGPGGGEGDTDPTPQPTRDRADTVNA